MNVHLVRAKMEPRAMTMSTFTTVPARQAGREPIAKLVFTF